MIGSAWTTSSFLAELEKDLGAAVGENFTAGKVWNGVVAGVVSWTELLSFALKVILLIYLVLFIKN